MVGRIIRDESHSHEAVLSDLLEAIFGIVEIALAIFFVIDGR